MSHRISIAGLALVVVSSCAGGAGAQDDARFETYLERHGLVRPLVVHLEQQFRSGDPAERNEIAAELADLYISLMAESEGTDAAPRWQARAQSLVDEAPDSVTRDLRLELAAIRFKAARRIADLTRLGLASPDEILRASRDLRDAARDLSVLGQDAHRESESLDSRSRRNLPEDEDKRVREARQRAIAARSRAMYIAGWSEYYLSWLADDRERASMALVRFGWLLGAEPNDAASITRLEPSRLAFAHVAEAALGCALANAQLGRTAESIAWLNAVSDVPDLDAQVESLLLPVRILVYASAGRWEDLDVELRRARVGGQRALPPRVAHLAALESLTAREEDRLEGGSVRSAADRVATAGLSDLISAGQVPLVLDLVERFGTDLLGYEGFVVYYVRAIRALSNARDAHASGGEDENAPTQTAAIANSYRAAADLFKGALNSSDASRFADERAEAASTLGLTLFLANDLDEAAEMLERAYEQAATEERREEALWLLVRTRLQAVKSGRATLQSELNRVAVLYTRSFPSNPRASRILLDPDIDAGMDPLDTARSLLTVSQDSAFYENAQQRSLAVLFQAIAKRQVSDIEEARALFVRAASARIEELAPRAVYERSQPAIDEYVLRNRQILEAYLTFDPPQVNPAVRSLAVLRRFVEEQSIEIPRLGEELLYRDLQIALHRGESQRVAEIGARLQAEGGGFAAASRGLLYNWARAQWSKDTSDTARARDVVTFGRALFESLPDGVAGALGASVASRIAEAASVVAESGPDEFATTALEFDAMLIEANRADSTVMRRHATMLESGGDAKKALEMWRTLASALSESDPGWFEARFNTIRLVAAQDTGRARDMLAQHELLHPGGGPAPWGARFGQLRDRVGEGGG